MLAVLCVRFKPRILSSFLSSLAHGSAVHHHHHNHNLYLNSRFISGPVQFADGYHRRDDAGRRRRHSSACQLGAAYGGAASIWHAILPSSGCGLGVGGGRRCDRRRQAAVHFDQLKGEGSWNAALDARPARWLHRADSAWLLFGVCACLAPATLEIGGDGASSESPPSVSDQRVVVSADSESSFSDVNIDTYANYTVTGMHIDIQPLAHVHIYSFILAYTYMKLRYI